MNQLKKAVKDIACYTYSAQYLIKLIILCYGLVNYYTVVHCYGFNVCVHHMSRLDNHKSSGYGLTGKTLQDVSLVTI